MTSRMPCSSTGGSWSHFPDVSAAAGFLRHVILPQFLEIWLVRDEWDSDSESHIVAEDLFDRALESKECRYEKNIPEMRKIVALIDQTIESDSDEACCQFLAKSVKKFNKYWSDADTWCFEMELFHDPVSVGKQMANDG
jgi:hypothetical protein